MKDICIILTGGTFDKVHDTLTESLGFMQTPSPHIEELLSIGRSRTMTIIPLMQKDSLEMDAGNRDAILSAVLSAPCQKIIIIHGTGTMELTAKHLNGNIGERTVVLTGAMRPFSLGKSDAGFNVGGAIIAVQTLPSGVYGVMNGAVFSAKELRKDVKAGRFDLG
jgi:L-asparaginase